MKVGLHNFLYKLKVWYRNLTRTIDLTGVKIN